LSTSPFISSINTYRKARPEREVGGIDLTLNAVTRIHDLYPELDGSNLTVSIKENAFDTQDIDFRNRIFQPEVIPPTSDIHATMMATIVAGAGNSSPDGTGVAKNAIIAFDDFVNLAPESTTELQTNGITVQNHSYGVDIENFYGIESSLYDKQTFEYPELLHVFSSGNIGNEASIAGRYAGVRGFANLTGQFKMSKNTISVGNTNIFGEIAPLSSRGPAYDGRMKPEVVAHGDQGSSDAAAIVSGISLLMQQAYRDNHGNVLPPSSLIKAVLTNSADDKGRPQVDYEYGFGSVDALGCVNTIVDERYFIDEVENGATKFFVINVPTNARELKVTVAWTDKDAEPGIERALVNDLDLEVYHPASNTVFHPWCLSTFPNADSLSKNAARRADHLNTIEQITIPNAVSGDYQIRVKGFDISSAAQTFSVAYEVVDEFQWIYPSPSDALVAGEMKLLRWKWNGTSLTGRLNWRIKGDDEWQSIGEVDMYQEYFTWNVPTINDIIELKISWNSEEFITDNVRVSGILFPEIGYYCNPEGLVLWNDDDSESYNVYALGEKFMQLFINTQDTIYITDESSHFISIASVVKGEEGRRSRLVDLQNGVCYITSFLPEHVITDSVSLFLTLGTTIGVKSFVLERLTAQGAIVVQSVEPVTNRQFILHDPSPVQGANHYQIRLTRSGGEQTLSQVEEVFFIREDELQFYPNPVTAGEPVTVIMNAETSEFWIQDMLGKTVNASYDDAELKTIETSALVPGMYIIKSVSPAGRVLTGRIVIK
jgi:hypothetical protein